MSWEESNRDLVERIRAYVLEFQNVKPAILSNFDGGSDPIFPLKAASDRGIGLLLAFCSLYQNIGEGRLVRLMAYLWKQYDQDIFRLNRLPFADLQEKMKVLTDLDDWPLWAKTPGVLRSVCDFFYRNGKILTWVYSQGDGEKCVDILSEEIFLMGKTSAFRTKARYFIWLLTQLDGAEPDRFWTKDMRMTLTMGHGRFVREFGPLKTRKTAPWTTPSEKLDYFNRFYRFLFPSASWMVFTAFDAYMRPQAGYRYGPGSPPPEWTCRKVMGGCIKCALAPECPGRDF